MLLVPSRYLERRARAVLASLRLWPHAQTLAVPCAPYPHAAFPATLMTCTLGCTPTPVLPLPCSLLCHSLAAGTFQPEWGAAECIGSSKPALPSELVPVVRQQLTLEMGMEEYNETELRSKLATRYAISPGQIALSVAPGSLIINVSITPPRLATNASSALTAAERRNWSAAVSQMVAAVSDADLQLVLGANLSSAPPVVELGGPSIDQGVPQGGLCSPDTGHFWYALTVPALRLHAASPQTPGPRPLIHRSQVWRSHLLCRQPSRIGHTDTVRRWHLLQPLLGLSGQR